MTDDRFIPPDIEGVLRLLADRERLPDSMKVEADPDTGIVEQTVGELRARTTWPGGLAVIIPRESYPEAVVKISKSDD